jgi:hypothetical protein
MSSSMSSMCAILLDGGGCGSCAGAHRQQPVVCLVLPLDMALQQPCDALAQRGRALRAGHCEACRARALLRGALRLFRPAQQVAVQLLDLRLRLGLGA